MCTAVNTTQYIAVVMPSEETAGPITTLIRCKPWCRAGSCWCWCNLLCSTLDASAGHAAHVVSALEALPYLKLCLASSSFHPFAPSTLVGVSFFCLLLALRLLICLRAGSCSRCWLFSCRCCSCAQCLLFSSCWLVSLRPCHGVFV
jgi:hypothetical protein